MGSRRSNIEIIAEILRLGQSNAGKTRIMYIVNMSHLQLEKYINFLVEGEFLLRIQSECSAARSTKYYTTVKGKRLLRDIDKLSALLGLGAEEAGHK